MIITNDWTFVHIPRNGGTSLKTSYLEANYDLQLGRDILMHPIERQDLLRPHEIIDLENMNTFATEFALVNHWESFIPDGSKLFTIVRHPYQRFQSLCRRAYDLELTDPKENCLDIDFMLNHEGFGSWKPNNTMKEYLDSTTKPITIYKYETEYEKAHSDHGLIKRDTLLYQSNDQTNILTPENIVKLNDHYHDDFIEFGYTKE